jgi:hypothetical protein
VRVAWRGGVSVDGARRGAGLFFLALLRVLHVVPFLVAVRGGNCPGGAGGELVGEVVRVPVRGWDVQGVGTGAGAADEAQSSPFTELGEQIALLDLEFVGKFTAVPVAVGLANTAAAVCDLGRRV